METIRFSSVKSLSNKAKTLRDKLFSLELQLLSCHRLIRNLINLRNKTKLPFGIIVRALVYLTQVITSCHIHPSARIGENCSFPHPTGIVIGKNTIVGNNVRIFQNVTLGSHGYANKPNEYPIVEDNVTLYAGAIVLGGIHVGFGATIGAGSIVTRDIPPYSIAYGNPARIRGYHCSNCGNKVDFSDYNELISEKPLCKECS